MHGVGRFTGAFGAVFTAIGAQIVKTLAQAPRANAIAGHWIGSARRECLDRILITGERHPRLVLREYADHYNTPSATPGAEPDSTRGANRFTCRKCLCPRAAARPARRPDPRTCPGRMR